jgi:hypothetical protein
MNVTVETAYEFTLMNTMNGLLLVGLVLFYFIGNAIITQLKLIVDRVGALAEATWRVRDELAQINKRNSV